MRRYLVEGIGTFFLVLALSITAYPLSIGLMLAAMIYFGGHVSGGQFNPALSLAMFFRQRLSPHHLIWYIVAQTVGALVAAELFYILAQTPLAFPAAPDLLACLVNEVLPTFVLTAVFLEVFTCSRFKVAELSGLVVGLTLTGISHFPGLFNPAIRLASLITAVVHSVEPVAFGNELLYILCPFVGALIATATFNYINNEEPFYKQ